MYKNSDKNGDDTATDFWDISSLVKKTSPTPSDFSPTIRLSTVSDGEKKEESEKTRLSFSRDSFDNQHGTPSHQNGQKEIQKSESDFTKVKEGVFSYSPKNNYLIKEVRIFDEDSSFNFYATFKSDAIKLFYEEGTECSYTPYFSYVPQYVQLTEGQKNYYLYWRSCLRKGQNIKTDYSYFWLYVYEIINLPDIIPPNEAVLMLCKVWRDYREALPNIDKNMMTWLCDYCLLHAVDCPRAELDDFIASIIEESEFKEFYLGYGNFDDVNVEYVVSSASDYNWHKSKVLKTERAIELFDRHMNSSLRAPLGLLFESGQISLSEKQTQLLSYSAFRRSLCGYFNRKRLEIEYHSLSHAASIRALVTMIVKYAENKLRSMLGVKSRLAIVNLPNEYKNVIDTYFDALPENNVRKATPRPEYEKLYDSLDSSISLSDAYSIEQNSWEVARMLTDDGELNETSCPPLPVSVTENPKESKEELVRVDTSFDERKDIAMSQDLATEAQSSCDSEQSSDSFGLSQTHVSFISALLQNDEQSKNTLLSSLGASCESVCEYINEIFFDNFGDIIIDITENGCYILSDYIQEVSQWLKTNLKN